MLLQKHFADAHRDAAADLSGGSSERVRQTDEPRIVLGRAQVEPTPFLPLPLRTRLRAGGPVQERVDDFIRKQLPPRLDVKEKRTSIPRHLIGRPMA
jgi:hypothetical protein